MLTLAMRKSQIVGKPEAFIIQSILFNNYFFWDGGLIGGHIGRGSGRGGTNVKAMVHNYERLMTLEE